MLPAAEDAKQRREARRVQQRKRKRSEVVPTVVEDNSASEDDEYAGMTASEIKKRKRMVRNRESAAASRKKKNDRITELEAQVQFLLAGATAQRRKEFEEFCRLRSAAAAAHDAPKVQQRSQNGSRGKAMTIVSMPASAPAPLPPASPLSTSSSSGDDASLDDLDLMASDDFTLYHQEQQQHHYVLNMSTQRCATHESAAFVTPTTCE